MTEASAWRAARLKANYFLPPLSSGNEWEQVGVATGGRLEPDRDQTGTRPEPGYWDQTRTRLGPAELSVLHWCPCEAAGPDVPPTGGSLINYSCTRPSLGRRAPCWETFTFITRQVDLIKKTRKKKQEKQSEGLAANASG